MHKLQTNVSEEFSKFAESLVDVYKKQHPEDLASHAPRSANQIIPSAMCVFAKSIGVDVPAEIAAEAILITSRKPGPKKKDDRQTTFVDGLPGVWISSVRISTGTVMVEVGDKCLSLQGCHVLRSAVEAAYLANWGAIPEERDGVPGLRFIPPGTSLASEPVKPPKPNTTEVGVFISDEKIRSGAFMILQDCRVVPNDEKAGDVIRFVQAKLKESEETIQLEATKESLLQKRVANSFRIANADAAEMGWTVRRETRRRKKGFRYIPPGAKLRYVLPEGEIEVGED
jgi:hypothetical protein